MTADDDGVARWLSTLTEWPRTHLAILPTPLTTAPRLATALGAPEIYLKLDSETGFALGGNKVRKLEYELAPSRLRDVTCLITAGGPQSNHCRVTAAFAARAGLRCVLVMQEAPPEPATGNALLHRLFGAEVHVVASREDRGPGMLEMAVEVERGGGRPLIVPIGASTGLGSLGYARAALELIVQLGQLDPLDPRPETTLLFVSTSSAGTLAGLLVGLSLAGRRDIVPVGVSADARADEIRETAVAIAADGARLLGADIDPGRHPFHLVDTQVGEGYGIPTRASDEATELFGRLAGTVLDPTYTAKAGAGMIDWIRERGAPHGERIVFLHTGGHPRLFA